MSGDLVITVAPCGAETTREQAPGVPYTPDEIADEARLAFDAGARMVHVHARWDDGTPTQDADRYIATVAAIRRRAPDMIVQVSTGGAIGMTAEERLGSLAAEPEMASRAQLAAGVRPELEIFDAGHLDNARWLAAKAPLEGPQHHDLVLGVPGGIAGTAQNVVMLSDRLPTGSTWSATGIGRSFLPVVTAALACGGHVRCGFEDQVEVEPGVPAASNADLVARVAAIAKLLGRSPATPARARELLGLK